MTSLKKRDLQSDWGRRWIEADFSWSGLASKSPPAGVLGSYQDFIRRISGGSSDAQMEASGLLANFKGRGLYHILFVPPYWLENGSSDYDKRNRQRADIFHTLRGSIQNFSSWVVLGLFIDSEFLDIFSRNLEFQNCYFEGDLECGKSRHWLRLAGVFIDGSIIGANPLTNNIRVDLSNSCVNGSAKIHSDGRGSAVINIKNSKISESISIGNVSVSEFQFLISEIGNISVENGVFDGRLSVSQCEFTGGISVKSSEFKDKVEIIKSSFPRLVRFLDCDFGSRVVFRDISWPDYRLSCAETKGSKFKDLVTFVSKAPPPIQFFDGSDFEANASFDNRYAVTWDEKFLEELGQSLPSQNERMQLAARVESGSRNLRKLAQARADSHMEQFWHRAEIISRRSGLSVGIVEKVASKIYGHVANYGLSIELPFIYFGISICGFALIYAYTGGIGWYGSLDWKSVEQGFGFSLHQALPIGVFGETDRDWLDRLIGQEFAWRNLLVRLIATVQTMISAVLIFLGVMAVRRKFKIG